MKKTKIGILGATGMVGQRFVSLLEDHPYFDVVVLAASEKSEGKTYPEAVEGRWFMKGDIPEFAKEIQVESVHNIKTIAEKVDMVLCALDMETQKILSLEEAYAKEEVVVVSNNSANRMVEDVPMLIPELNVDHLALIETQKKRLGTQRGFIAVKPNCSIQSYVPLLYPLRHFGIREVAVSTYQAISGAGKNFEQWPEMVDNVIPFISGEEAKSELEPLKIFAGVKEGKLEDPDSLTISAHCVRVPVTDGHLATVSVRFDKKPSKEEILDCWRNFETSIEELKLPSAPVPFIRYFEEENFPQTRVHRDAQRGMQISAGRLREDRLFDYKFVGLSHNTLRGAAGGALLVAELLKAKGYLEK